MGQIISSDQCQDCIEQQEFWKDETKICEFHTCKACGNDNFDSCTDICERCQNF